MKTFRMIGMALVAVLLCVNFASCSGSDDEPEINEEGVVTNEKKLVEIKTSYDSGDKDTTIFSYNNKGRLISCKAKNNKDEEFKNNNIEEYTWGNDLIIGSSYTFKLSNGIIIDWDGDPCKYNSSNQLISDDDGEFKSSYTWENGNLTKQTYYGTTVQFNYSNKTCKGHFPLMAPALFYTIDCGALYYVEYGLFMAHPDLLGIRTKQLPNKIIESGDSSSEKDIYSIDYSFTKDGYIESCTIQKDEYNNDNNLFRSSTTIVTFTWE